jgi:hypothetical protein
MRIGLEDDVVSRFQIAMERRAQTDSGGGYSSRKNLMTKRQLRNFQKQLRRRPPAPPPIDTPSLPETPELLITLSPSLEIALPEPLEPIHPFARSIATGFAEARQGSR